MGQIRGILKSLVRNQFQRMGYEIISPCRVEQLPLINTLRFIFEKFDIHCVFDVGANKGQYRDFLRAHIKYKGLIISFEPINKNAKLLEEKAKNDTLWVVCPYALGNVNKNQTLNVMKMDVFSSFSTPDHSTVNIFSDMNIVAHEEVVEIKRLDDVFGDLNQQYALKNIFLKMDTQGHDLEVFKGSEETLSHVLALQSEVSVKPIYTDMPDYFTSIRTFTEAGFEIAGLYPVTAVEGRVIEFDCVMINKMAEKIRINA